MEDQMKKVAELVYFKLLDQLTDPERVPWVEAIYVPGHPCCEGYEEMLEAYSRLRERLGVNDEDPDCEIMINGLLRHGGALAMEMFRYGVEYGKRQTLSVG